MPLLKFAHGVPYDCVVDDLTFPGNPRCATSEVVCFSFLLPYDSCSSDMFPATGASPFWLGVEVIDGRVVTSGWCSVKNDEGNPLVASIVLDVD